MIVVDASAVVDVLIDQPTKESVLAELDQPLLAPAHQLAEIASAIGRLLRAGAITRRVGDAALRDAAALHQTHIVPTQQHLRRALALQERIRVLDGLYVALAEEHGCPLLTSDARLAAADPPCPVVLATATSG